MTSNSKNSSHQTPTTKSHAPGFRLPFSSFMLLTLYLLLCFPLTWEHSHAQSNEGETVPAIEEGRRQVKVVCSACHGMEGLSLHSLYPNLKGQKKDYLINQLKLLKEGKRRHNLMESYARPLTEKQISNLATYYSSFQRFEIQNRPVPPPAQQCIACHGPMGKSATELFPNLSGQRYEYLVNQMRNLKSGKRVNAVMNPILKDISDEDIQTIARFFTMDRIN